MKILCRLILASTFIFCSQAMAETQYYLGDISYSSPNGSTSFGKTQSLLKREIQRHKGSIVDTTIQRSARPSSNFEVNIAYLWQIKNTPIFRFNDYSQNYSGEVSFEGREWMWESWTYDLSMKTGEKITGIGRLTEEGMLVEKQFIRDDSLVMNIKETWLSISRRQYEKQYRALTGEPAPSKK